MTTKLGNISLLTPIYTKSEVDELLEQKVDISHISDFNNPHKVTGQQLGILTNSNEIRPNLVTQSSIQDWAISSEKIALEDEEVPGVFYTITIRNQRLVVRKLFDLADFSGYSNEDNEPICIEDDEDNENVSE